MTEHDVRAAKRQEAALARQECKRAREVQMELEKDRVKWEGELRSATHR
jgi:hypothetical protein